MSALVQAMRRGWEGWKFGWPDKSSASRRGVGQQFSWGITASHYATRLAHFPRTGAIQPILEPSHSAAPIRAFATVPDPFGVVWRRFDEHSKCREEYGLAKSVPPILACDAIALAPWNHEVQNTAMRTPKHATKRRFVLPPCFPETGDRAGKQISQARGLHNLFSFRRKTGAGEGIRTLDPNLGNVRVSLFRSIRRL